ncbi:MAG TPA: hypothetical protein VFQ22_07200 [Longimicrobiales bacterium]|nr:hypothetical protein [Longimicrobiales bacterium]
MPRARSIFAALFMGATLFVVGCSDLPTAPEVPQEELSVEPQQGLLGNLVGGLVNVVGGTVNVLDNTIDTVVDVVEGILSPVLTREDPLSRDEVASQWIGPWGGVIRLPRAGLTVTVPPGALDRYTKITVRAPAGDLFGYEFLPHGLHFDRPIVAVQEVTRSEASGGLEAIYFEGDIEPEVMALEVLPVATIGDRAFFRIEHFSWYAFRRTGRDGYVIATN